MRLTTLCVAVCLCAVAHGASKKAKVVDGKKVVPSGTALVADPIGEVTALRFIPVTDAETGAPFTVIAGYFTSNLPSGRYVVTLSFKVYDAHVGVGSDSIGPQGRVVVEIDRPERGKPRSFVALGPPSPAAHDKTKRVLYALTMSERTFTWPSVPDRHRD